MAIPADPLPIRQQLYIDGAWTTVTSTTREAQNVKITRGFSSEQSAVSAGNAIFRLDNRTHDYSNRNPNSQYFGKLGMNTQYRCGVYESVRFLKFADYNDATGLDGDGATCWTADKAVLDITGDIDVRIDIEWDHARPLAQILASKYLTTSDERSWLWYMSPSSESQKMTFTWSTDGTSGARVFATSTEEVPDTGRIALRVTVDVNNGAGGSTTTFYTSTSISGSWTQLGSPVVNSSASSIYAGTAELHVGNNSTDVGTGTAEKRNGIIASTSAFTGKIYGFQLRNGIGGTLVATMDPSAQAVGTTSWSDGLATPNTWTVTLSGEITDMNYRFWGEVPEFPQEWDSTGNDVTVPVIAYDRWSRLNQGAKPLKSSIYRLLQQYMTSTGISGWWPMEQDPSATESFAVVGRNGYIRDTVFSTDTDFPGTAGILVFSNDTAYASGHATNSGATTGTDYYLWYFKMAAVPASSTLFMTFYSTGGSYRRLQFSSNATAFNVTIVAIDGTVLLNNSTLFGSGQSPDQWTAMRFKMTQNGANIDWEWAWYDVGAPATVGTSGSFAGTVGKPYSWIVYPFTGMTGYSLTHIAMSRSDIGFSSDAFRNATNAYVNENVIARWRRLLAEEGIPNWVVCDISVHSTLVDRLEVMGPQRPLTLPELLVEIVTVDGGRLYCPRDKFGLTFHPRYAFTNRAGVELDYSADVFQDMVRPNEGIQNTRNDITVSNTAGDIGRYEKTTGPRNVTEPADATGGIGRYDIGPLVRNVYLASRLNQFAEFEVMRGTWDELRWPGITLWLSRPSLVADTVLSALIRWLDIGYAVNLSNLPAWLPPDDSKQLIIGYTEELMNRDHRLSYNLIPRGPFIVNDLTQSDESVFYAGTDNSTLSSGITSTATSWNVATATGSTLWLTGTGLALPVKIGGPDGELIMVGTISGTSSPQAFSVITRSVNGVVRAWDAGDSVDVAYPFFPTL